MFFRLAGYFNDVIASPAFDVEAESVFFLLGLEAIFFLRGIGGASISRQRNQACEIIRRVVGLAKEAQWHRSSGMSAR
jgi:hypothetical protein